MSKNFAIILVVILAIFGGIFYFAKKDAKAPSDQNASAQVTNHIKGNTSSGVVLVEYADFQCPACAQLYPVVSEIVDTYQDKIQFQFVNFPLYQIHQNAMAAHRAAEAASVQGKFWEMYDMLYAYHSSWQGSKSPSTLFEQYAQNIGLNVEQFRSDSASSAVNDILWADINKANALKINATPTFFLNGEKIETPTTLEEFKNVIDTAIAANTNSNQQSAEQPASDNTTTP